MIIITGASSGIGYKIAELCSEEEDVVLISRRDPKLNFADWIKCDLSDKNQLISLVKEIKAYKKNIEFLVHSPLNKIRSFSMHVPKSLIDAIDFFIVFQLLSDFSVNLVPPYSVGVAEISFLINFW